VYAKAITVGTEADTQADADADAETDAHPETGAPAQRPRRIEGLRRAEKGRSLEMVALVGGAGGGRLSPLLPTGGV
jgi:hypothetical protein